MNVRMAPVLNMVQVLTASIPMEAMSVAVHKAIEIMELSVKVSEVCMQTVGKISNLGGSTTIYLRNTTSILKIIRGQK